MVEGPTSCYDGAEGTSGVGACRDGTFGPCVGHVTPSTETCDGIDNDVAATSVATTGAPAPGAGYFFPVNCGGSGTYDTGMPSQGGG